MKNPRNQAHLQQQKLSFIPIAELLEIGALVQAQPTSTDPAQISFFQALHEKFQGCILAEKQILLEIPSSAKNSPKTEEMSIDLSKYGLDQEYHNQDDTFAKNIQFSGNQSDLLPMREQGAPTNSHDLRKILDDQMETEPDQDQGGDQIQQLIHMIGSQEGNEGQKPSNNVEQPEILNLGNKREKEAEIKNDEGSPRSSELTNQTLEKEKNQWAS